MVKLYGALSDLPWYRDGNAPLPKFQGNDIAGFYYPITGVVQPEIYDFRIRPTGNANSGPFFHSVKHDAFGIGALVKVNGRYYASHVDYTYENSGKSPITGKYIETYSRYFNNGRYSYQILVKRGDQLRVPDNGSRCMYYVRAIMIRGFNGRLHDDRVMQQSDTWFDTPGPELSYLVARCHRLVNEMLIGDPSCGFTDRNNLSGYYEASEQSLGLTPEMEYHFGELDAFCTWDYLGFLPGRYNGLAGQAYNDAASNLPRTTTNSIANVLETAELVSSIIKRDYKSLLPGDIKNAWLQYRYQYTTTRADVEEYAELTRRLLTVAGSDHILTYGQATDGNIRAQCGFYVNASDFIPSGVKGWLEQYGFKLTATNMWDMVPYSFIVDWFLHISDFLDACEQGKWAWDLKVYDPWTSFRTFTDHQSNYIRVPGRFHTKCPWIDYSQTGPSNKTIVKRVLDTVSIFG